MFKKPTILQIFFAKVEPVLLCLILCGLTSVWIFVKSFTYPELQCLFSSFLFGLSFVLVALLVGVTGFSLGIFLAVLTEPLNAMLSKINGAPFQDDDIVRIITGPHKDKRGRVYAVWDERRQVRVWLGEKENKDVTDVFSYLNVYKLPSGLAENDKSKCR